MRLPLERDQRLLVRVAVLAGGKDVAARRSAAAAERNAMVHRQRAVPDRAVAVVAHALGDAPLPPLTLAQLPRLRAFSAQLLGIDRRAWAIPGAASERPAPVGPRLERPDEVLASERRSARARRALWCRGSRRSCRDK